jgi:ElaB/YqjD/DUF883 family membrane-anchored ribosome-binding protein
VCGLPATAVNPALVAADSALVALHGVKTQWPCNPPGATMASTKNNIMKTPDTHEAASEAAPQSKDLRERALEKIREGADAADRVVHRNTYNVLAAGTVVGFVLGFLVSRGCRCCAT